MKGGRNASYIIEEYKRKKAFTSKKRNVCIIDEKKQCDKCKYNSICIDCEVKDEKMD